MNYEALFADATHREVTAALIGVGEFGSTLIAQSLRIPGLRIPVLCDQAPERVIRSLRRLGIESDRIAICETRSAAEQAVRAGRYAIVASGAMAAELPVDIVIEATGSPLAAAENARHAIDAGRHLAMVTKEAESVIGPALKLKAKSAGVVHCLVDGDQPSLLIGLISWARTLGLDIVAAGKSSEYDFVYDAGQRCVSWNGQHFAIGELEDLWQSDSWSISDLVAARSQRLSAIPQRTVPDLCEMGLVCNATGLKPDREDFHAPVLRTLEVPRALSLATKGGLLAREGVVDVFNCLRRPDDPSFAGGVFVNVACHDAETWEILARKGIPVSRKSDCAMLYNPQHLLGLEAPISILLAVRLGLSSGGIATQPTVDLVARTERHFQAGEVLAITNPHTHAVAGLEPLLLPAAPLATTTPVPYYLAIGCRLRHDVEAGAFLTLDAVEIDRTSSLWQLRCEQDRWFFNETAKNA